MNHDLKQTLQASFVTFILGAIAFASLVGSGVLVFSPPDFITEFSDTELKALRATLDERDIIDFRLIENGTVEYAYVGEELPPLLAENEDVSKRTGSSYTRALGKGAGGEDVFELVAFPHPQFIERSGVWYTIEYSVAPKELFFRQGLLSFIAGRVAYADTVYSGSGDGVTNGYSTSSWSAVRNATSALTADYTAILFNVSSSYTNFKDPSWNIQRGFLPFDTSSVPATAEITDASLVVHATSTVYNGENDGSDYITVVETSQATHTSLVVADYDNIVTTEGIDSGQRKDITSISSGDSLTFTLNATGRGWIARSGESSNCSATNGITCLGLREGHDNANDEPTTNILFGNRVTFDTSEATGTTYDPYLSVTYGTFAPWQFDPF